MKTNTMKTANELMKGWTIDEVDATRIILEALEKLGMEGGGRMEVLARLRQVVDEGVRAVQDGERTERFEVVAWASVEERAHRRPTTRRDLRYYVRRMLRVEGAANLPLRRMTVSTCRDLLNKAFGGSPSSYKKGRAILHSIFAYGMRREWCEVNPVDRIATPHVVEKPVVPLTLEEVARLESTVRLPEHAPMRFSLQLMLYCGLRPGEVQRLQPEDVRCAEREVIIRPAVSKTGGGRVVPLREDMLQSWSLPGCWEARWRALRRASGFTRWQADACRHSFASYHAAYYRDLKTLQYEMGHCNLQLLLSRYISPVSRADSKRYWAKHRKEAEITGAICQP